MSSEVFVDIHVHRAEMNHHLNTVEEFVCLYDPKSCVVQDKSLYCMWVSGGKVLPLVCAYAQGLYSTGGLHLL